MFLKEMEKVAQVFTTHFIHSDIKLKKKINGVGGGDLIKLSIYINKD